MFKTSEIAAFWSRLEKAGPDECWLWKAGHNGLGYGVLYVDRKPFLAHRFSMSLALGRRVPKGRFVLHSCDTPRCCNPSHLRLGSQRENVADAIARGRHKNPPSHHGPAPHRRMPRGEDNSQAKMTASAMADLYAARLSGSNYSSIGRSFGLDPSTVKDACEGRIWAHLLGVDGNPTLAQLAAIPIDRKPSAKITADMARSIKLELASGQTGRSIAAKYGIHFASVSDIKRGATWKDA